MVYTNLRLTDPHAKAMTRGPAETTRMSERFVKGFGTSYDACGSHGCALLAHIFAAFPWWLRIALLAGPTCFAASSGPVTPHILPPDTLCRASTEAMTSLE